MADKEYIEREAIQKRLNRIVEVNNLRTDLAWFTPYGVKALIEEIPAADVRPARRGKWIDMGDFISCSSCNATRLKEFESDYGKVMRLDARTNFCPNCGADMREES